MNRTRLIALLGATLCAGLLPIASSAAPANRAQRQQPVRVRQEVRRDDPAARERERRHREIENARRRIQQQKPDKQDRK